MPTVSLRVAVPLPLYEKISTFRHESRHETRNRALVCLINAGLAALARPASLPPQPGQAKRLVSYAGHEGGNGRTA
ncbi:MAG TPA: hypothetical protein VGX71_25430 [Pseudaminobacter sp.]|nr:hypothetical protein [Pseudaminobacter sp.]